MINIDKLPYSKIIRAPQNNENELTSSERLEHLVKVHADVREEIKQRISQRDKYVIQNLISTGFIFAVTFTKIENKSLLLLLPITHLYFLYLIDYSYQIHNRLAEYLRDVVEDEMHALIPSIRTNRFSYLETYFGKNRKESGIRSSFFSNTFIYAWAICLVLLFESHFVDGAKGIIFISIMVFTMYIYLIKLKKINKNYKEILKKFFSWELPT